MSNNAESIARLITKFSPQEIRLLFKTARSVVINPSLVIKRAKKQHPQIGRILIVIPRVVGSAVERNLLRRQIKNIFYQERLFEKPFDLFISLKKGAAAITFDQLRSLLLEGAHNDS